MHWKDPEFEQVPWKVPEGQENVDTQDNKLHFNQRNNADAQSVDLPSDGERIAVTIFGNQVEISKDGDIVTVSLSADVCNRAQIDAHEQLKKETRQADELIGVLLTNLSALQSAWCLRGIAPMQTEVQEFKRLAAALHRCNLRFVKDCETLSRIWNLDVETAKEVRTWTLSQKDPGVTAIFMRDWRNSGCECAEVRFWFSCVAMPPLIKTFEAHVAWVRRCVAPYRPFDVAERWEPATVCTSL